MEQPLSCRGLLGSVVFVAGLVGMLMAAMVERHGVKGGWLAAPGPSTAAGVCPYCHDPLGAAPASACQACGRHHEECLDEHGGCTVAGCRDAPDQRARARA